MTTTPPNLFDEMELSEQQQVLQTLEKVFENRNPRLPENVFHGVFLPFFCQDPAPKYQVTLQNWINVCIHPSSPVDITDAQGNVIYTVPPLIHRDVVNSKNTEGQVPMFHMARTFQQYNDYMPSQGRAYLEQQFERRKLIKETTPLLLEQIKEWDKIFKRYGRPTILRDADFDAETKANAVPSGDEFDYVPL